MPRLSSRRYASSKVVSISFLVLDLVIDHKWALTATTRRYNNLVFHLPTAHGRYCLKVIRYITQSTNTGQIPFVMAQPSMKACLTTVPTEVRAKILQYVLPECTPATIWDQCASGSKYHQITKLKTKDGRWTWATPARNHYSILLVNKQLTAEVKRLINCQCFRVSIQEGSQTLDWTVASLQSKRCGTDTNTSWLPAYPGLDLSELRNFTVRIIPSDSAYFWAWALSASTTLCETRLLPDSPPKRFCIVLTDMVSSVVWNLLADWNFSGPRLRRIAAVLGDYEKTLDVFSPVAAAALECEVHLPSWVEHHPEVGRVLEKWQGKIRARIFFDAYAPSTSEIPSSSGNVDDHDDTAKPLEDSDNPES